MLKLHLVCLFCLATAKISIYSPEALKLDMKNRYYHGEIRNSLANFGKPPYGSVIIGRVFYSESQSDACLSISPFNWTDNPEQVNSTILLAERGSCYFSIKARHAEDFGAKALVVIDDKEENPEIVTISYGGNAGKILIPTLLISKSDGGLIKRYIRNSNYTNHVALSLAFDMPQSGSKISYDLYTSSEFSNVYDFLKTFAPIASGIKKEHATFKPHYVTSECKSCIFFLTPEKNCVSGGRYCIEPPKGSVLDGRAYIYENLREICIYRQTDKEEAYALYFDYMKYYQEFCLGYITDDCVEKAMNKANVNIDKVNLCINQSFQEGNPLIVDNVLLKSEREYFKSFLSFFYPSIVVNNQYYRGDWDPENVVRAMCAAYSNGQDAEFCKESSPGKDKDDDDDNKSIGAGTVVLILTLCAMIILIIFVLYRKCIGKGVNDGMRKQVDTEDIQLSYVEKKKNNGERQDVRV